MLAPLRFLLFQVRNHEDPMRTNEVLAFARALNIAPERIAVCDLLSESANTRNLDRFDMLLFGGSGHYSAAEEGDWLERALDLLREVHRSGKPTFASCWGFQAMARALGGTVIHDLSHAEVGTHRLWLTESGQNDPLFKSLGPSFLAQMGHEDRVVTLPPEATLLASTDCVENQAYRFDDRPIYCTQFHPELTREDLIARVRNYPEYIQRIAHLPTDEFCATVQPTIAANSLLKRFVAMVFE